MGNVKYNEPTSFEEMEEQEEKNVPATEPAKQAPVETNETTE